MTYNVQCLCVNGEQCRLQTLLQDEILTKVVSGNDIFLLYFFFGNYCHFFSNNMYFYFHGLDIRWWQYCEPPGQPNIHPCLCLVTGSKFKGALGRGESSKSTVMCLDSPTYLPHLELSIFCGKGGHQFTKIESGFEMKSWYTYGYWFIQISDFSFEIYRKYRSLS